MRSKRERRGGQYGNKRGRTVQQEQRARKSNRRVTAALEATRAEQASLDARMAAEERQAQAVLRQRRAPSFDRETELAALQRNIELRSEWPLSEARHLVRSGYTPEATEKRTGWPLEMLADVTPHEW